MFPLVGYVLLFLVIGSGFILIHLLLGKLIRPNRPNAEKETIYECGEPTIGSAWVQFDLRFYVVALLFVIFDVEVAFFFPWAVVFGKANNISAAGQPADADAYHQLGDRVAEVMPPQERIAQQWKLDHLQGVTPEQVARVEELKQLKEEAKSKKQNLPADQERELAGMKQTEQDAADAVTSARKLAWLSLWDILVFFGVLLVGFAYLWRRGDLAWVRSVSSETATPLRSVVGARGEAPPPSIENVGAGSGLR